ncbi:MAG TPA: trehalose-phosphatase, partial [Acidimicrobiales bacterium]|nr:trehalose-phosphatase [Acidimicrobiales bacterium]
GLNGHNGGADHDHDPPRDHHHDQEEVTVPPEWAARFAPFLADPAASAVLTDFDGTLAAIVADPARAQPLAGTRQVLVELGRQFGTVAVISGRPASFLADRLGGIDGIRLVGSYGVEWAGADGVVTTDPAIDQWRPVVAAAAARLAADAPPGVLVEDKALSVTVHWRRAPEAEGWVRQAAASESERSGLVGHSGRMSVELRTPGPTDKGSAVEELSRGARSACFLGDDVGDLPAFAALDRLAAQVGTAVVKVAAADQESPPEVTESADLIVEGPPGALRLLRWLAHPGDG